MEKEKVSMYDENIEYDYEQIIADSDDLFDYEEEYDYDYTNEKEYNHYYHDIVDELEDY